MGTTSGLGRNPFLPESSPERTIAYSSIPVQAATAERVSTHYEAKAKAPKHQTLSATSSEHHSSQVLAKGWQMQKALDGSLRSEQTKRKPILMRIHGKRGNAQEVQTCTTLHYSPTTSQCRHVLGRVEPSASCAGFLTRYPKISPLLLLRHLAVAVEIAMMADKGPRDKPIACRVLSTLPCWMVASGTRLCLRHQ